MPGLSPSRRGPLSCSLPQTQCTAGLCLTLVLVCLSVCLTVSLCRQVLEVMEVFLGDPASATSGSSAGNPNPSASASPPRNSQGAQVRVRGDHPWALALTLGINPSAPYTPTTRT